MQIYQPIVLVALMALGVLCAPVAQPDAGETQLNTNIAVLNPGVSLDDLKASIEQGLVLVDPTKLLDKLPEPEPGSVIEDKADRFITDDDGKLRPRLVVNTDVNWAGDSERLVTDLQPESKPLHRVKRCGGGGGGDDDGDNAQRARRRRTIAKKKKTRKGRTARKRAQKARLAANGAITQTTTTTVRKVIGPDGQVISETVVPQQGIVQAQPTVQTVMHQPQVVVRQQQPVVVAHPQPVAVQQQPVMTQPKVVSQPQVIAQPQVVAQPQLAAAQPSISVTGSVKVN